MRLWSSLHRKPDTVLLRLLLTVPCWILAVLACGLFFNNHFTGFMLAIISTLLAGVLFVAFLIEALVRIALDFRHRRCNGTGAFNPKVPPWRKVMCCDRERH